MVSEDETVWVGAPVNEAVVNFVAPKSSSIAAYAFVPEEQLDNILK